MYRSLSTAGHVAKGMKNVVVVDGKMREGGIGVN
jgi:hypothetical protein